ncbi:DEAD/DEAH box helicase [Ophiocordyceps camponoti-floridani]|uniref:DEAD/DEAH box helicase n=1 Tax=Ophiocordyceps camponoti-floridani TaxID=2030778 RepID=A0A8H4Q3U5_9HYPO|nr:DEAD/DEAH box helicase [Ophiocordyceps camponoti-floridani]
MLALVPGLEDMAVETLDGDTPMSKRNSIRDEARVIMTNPDMLHMTILPQEHKWRTFFSNLTLVVVDELHYYNGILGSHMAFIIRRLRRLCAANGNLLLKFVSCSATAANPKQHFETMLGLRNVSLIDCDGSPSGRKEFICWNTPLAIAGDPSSGRKSAKSECALLFCALMLRGVRMIAFCRVRAQCEALVGAIREELMSLRRPECANMVMCYRGGYTAADRRMIESDMFEGKLMGIVATTALELGVDIGALDCVMTWGFPYTIANLRQQSGRAGRRNRDSLSILVGDCFPTDQHFMQNPDELFTRPNAELRVDLRNMIIREGHVQCAAFEMPIRPEQDSMYFGADLVKLCKDRLVADETGFFHCHDRFRPNPSRFMAVRDTDPDHFAIVDTTMGGNKVLEELEASRAIFTLYDGAIFLHQGQSYLVKEFLPDKLLAKVEKVKVDWFTTQRDYTDIDPIEIEAIRRISSSSSQVNHGTIRILQKVFGFLKVDKNGRILDAIEVDNPPIIRAPEDLRTECKIATKEFATTETQRKRPARLTFYDTKGGPTGSGITAKAFDYIDGLLKLALRRIEQFYSTLKLTLTNFRWAQKTASLRESRRQY